ncbi:uncharacterized protein LOC115439901 [Manduca sexta]|uniref:uncharacterized protein LOC115439901 n=1 Tax=Manduca sexta TaxID=7130 RepID=UPI0011829EAC|nr:uncharacterized protein LOC115439901 [Manduca sexta]
MGMVLSVVSNLLYFSEKITVCLALTALVCCIILTIILVLGFGIGLVPARSVRSEWPGSDRRRKTEFKGFDYEMFRRPNNSMEVSSTYTIPEVTESTIATESTNSTTLPTNSSSTITILSKQEYGPPTMIIPINGLDLIALLSRLRAENRNYSLQIVTS